MFPEQNNDYYTTPLGNMYDITCGVSIQGQAADEGFHADTYNDCLLACGLLQGCQAVTYSHCGPATCTNCNAYYNSSGYASGTNGLMAGMNVNGPNTGDTTDDPCGAGLTSYPTALGTLTSSFADIALRVLLLSLAWTRPISRLAWITVVFAIPAPLSLILGLILRGPRLPIATSFPKMRHSYPRLRLTMRCMSHRFFDCCLSLSGYTFLTLHHVMTILTLLNRFLAKLQFLSGMDQRI